LVRTVAEIAATAAAVAARDATRSPLRTSISAHTVAHQSPRHAAPHPTRIPEENEETIPAEIALHTEGGGHDAPNWSKLKSTIILLGATILYAIIAEILVNTVDVVLESVDIDEKFLGITLFALVPNTTEFLVVYHTGRCID
jgi:Ca2+:H+ antiporter